MSLEAIIYDPTYTTRLGAGPLHPAQASLTRRLDGVGQGAMRVGGADARAADLLLPRRIVELWTDAPARRLLGSFIIDTVRFVDDETRQLRVSGPDLLQHLKETITLPGTVYDFATFGAVLADLVGLTNFALDYDGSLDGTFVSLRFDGASVLGALQVLADTYGLHIRLGAGRTLQAGLFGAASGLRVQQTGHVPLAPPATLLLPQRVEQVQSSQDVVNWLLPTGAGAGDAVLTLAPLNSPRVTVITHNGRTHHILKHDASIAQYGQVERRVHFKRITPVDATDSAIQRAASALEIAGLLYLERHAQPQTQLRVLAKRPTQAILPGDTLTLAYAGPLYAPDGAAQPPRDLSGAYWVLSSEETYDEADPAGRVALELSTTDALTNDDAALVVRKLEEIEVQNVFVQPTLNHYIWGPYQQEIDPANLVHLRLRIRDATLALDKATLILRTLPFTATAQTASSTPSSHQHLIMRSEDGTSLQGTLATRRFTIVEQATGQLFHFDAESDVGAAPRFFDMQPGGAHTHDLQYGIQRDTTYPGNLIVLVNTTTVASGIGGTSAELRTEIDITQALLDKSGGVRGTHDIYILCGAGQGLISAECMIEEQIAQVRL